MECYQAIVNIAKEIEIGKRFLGGDISGNVVFVGP
jgi:hypothetical protein